MDPTGEFFVYPIRAFIRKGDNRTAIAGLHHPGLSTRHGSRLFTTWLLTTHFFLLFYSLQRWSLPRRPVSWGTLLQRVGSDLRRGAALRPGDEGTMSDPFDLVLRTAGLSALRRWWESQMVSLEIPSPCQWVRNRCKPRRERREMNSLYNCRQQLYYYEMVNTKWVTI